MELALLLDFEESVDACGSLSRHQFSERAVLRRVVVELMDGIAEELVEVEVELLTE